MEKVEFKQFYKDCNEDLKKHLDEYFSSKEKSLREYLLETEIHIFDDQNEITETLGTQCDVLAFNPDYYPILKPMVFKDSTKRSFISTYEVPFNVINEKDVTLNLVHISCVLEYLAVSHQLRIAGKDFEVMGIVSNFLSHYVSYSLFINSMLERKLKIHFDDIVSGFLDIQVNPINAEIFLATLRVFKEKKYAS